MGARGVIWVASPFDYNLPFHGDNNDDDGDGDSGYDDVDGDNNIPIGWNWPGTRPLVASLRETRVTEPPWVMFVTNLVIIIMRMRRKMMIIMIMMLGQVTGLLWVRFIMNMVYM